LPRPISDVCDGMRTGRSAVQEAVRMVAAAPDSADAEIRRLVGLPLSQEQLADLVRNLDPILDPQGPERFACTRIVWSFLEWLHRPEPASERLRQFLESWESVRSEGGQGSMSSWRDHERALATRLAA